LNIATHAEVLLEGLPSAYRGSSDTALSFPCSRASSVSSWRATSYLCSDMPQQFLRRRCNGLQR